MTARAQDILAVAIAGLRPYGTAGRLSTRVLASAVAVAVGCCLLSLENRLLRAAARTLDERLRRPGKG